MSYHRGGQAGAVAVSYSTSQMAPHSPSRRYSSGTGGDSTAASAIGGSTSKLNGYRSTGSSSILDRSTNGFYTSPTSSSLRSNYVSSEYRRSYCTSGRSVSSSSYGETVGNGSNSGSGLTTTTINSHNSGGGNKYTSTSIGSSSREFNNLDTLSTAADIISRYSPAGYVPNIQRQQQANSSSAHHWKHRSASSSLSELVGGDERELERSRDFRPESSLSSSSSSSSAVTSAGLWPRSNKRRPFTNSTVLAGHVRADSAAIIAEVTIVDDHVTCKLKNDEKIENNDDDNDDDSNNTKDINSYDNRYNNNNSNERDYNGDDIARRYNINNNDECDDVINNEDDNDDEDENEDLDNEDKNDDDVDDDEDDDDDDDEDEDEDEDDDDDVDDNDDDDEDEDDDNLNNLHHHHYPHHQHSHLSEEISLFEHDFLSAAAAAGGGGLINISNISLLTNHATNPYNIKLLINNNTQDKLTGRRKEEEETENENERISRSDEVIHNADNSASSIDAIDAFLELHQVIAPDDRTSERDISENEEDANASYNSLNEGGFGETPSLTQNGVAGRSSITHGDDHPSVPSTSRRTDQPSIFSSATSANPNRTSSPTNPSTTHQSIYRGVNEQYTLLGVIIACTTVIKLAQIQVIEWILWCLWTMITFVVTYAFCLGIVTPLVSAKRNSPKLNSICINNSMTVPSTAPHSIRSSITLYSQEGSPTNRVRNRLQSYRDEQCGLNGLRNIGNTCFMNSVIQCLSNTKPLLEYLLNEYYLNDINVTTSSMKGALIKAFSQVIHELWEVGGDHVVNTTALKSHIQRFAPRFMGYSQQDAQEFLRYLLEGLHEDVNRITVKLSPILGDMPDTYSDMQKAVESWKRYLRSEDSMVVDVFVGQLRSSLHCTSCDHVSVTLDPFWDLSLPIPARSGTVKLSQCLEHFTREEVLDGDEKPTCSKCQMRRKCTKSFSIQKFPKILVIHLKRFSPMERFRGKLNVMVDFPLTSLDLSAFAAPRVPGCTYNLYGVANHSGTTYSGHYTAYCKHPYSGEWHEYNDSRVSVVSARSVVSSEAYVLFYEQQPHSSHL